MRDSDRISIILEGIKEIWLKYPDMRLGQLICNVLKDPALYYIEDAELLKYLKDFYN